MKRASARTWRRESLAACEVLALALSCGRTDDPLEHYASVPLTPGAGGNAPAATGGNGNAAASMAGTSPGTSSGGSDALGGASPSSEAGAGGEAPVAPPEDACGQPPVSSDAFTRRALRAQAAD